MRQRNDTGTNPGYGRSGVAETDVPVDDVPLSSSSPAGIPAADPDEREADDDDEYEADPDETDDLDLDMM